MLIYLELLTIDFVKLKWITLFDGFTTSVGNRNNTNLMDLGFSEAFGLVPHRKIENQHGCIKLIKSC